MPGCCSGLLLVLSCASILAGCDTEPEEVELVPAETFAEGVAKDSDVGAFRVMLSTADGLAVGDNTLFIRLGFHDPHDPTAPGQGIPGADVVLDAWMPHGDGSIEGVRGIYKGDGEYEIELELSEPGVWQLDFDLAVGEGVHDSVSFAFIVGE
jgi:hypothetical protein